MKNLMFVLSVVVGVSAFAAQTVPANYFTCKGHGGTSVDFSTTSKIGKPMMSVLFRGEQVKATEALKLQRTLMGTLATVSDMHLVPIDGPTMRYTLVVPQVEIAGFEPVKFSSVVIRTSVSNPFMGPPGPTEHNEFVPVECTAQFVDF